ncbi:MAG TPA: LuxR C-terminal-related transcriptional regulator [Anaerolineales bacterium]|nr:LuxR C-terminal-related transcriptional regulator [Anaerolineales bacterium]
MSIWQRLLNRIGKRLDDSPRTSEIAENLQSIIAQLAQREGQPEHELTSDLVAAGLIQHFNREHLMPKWNSLSAREKEVARLIRQGLTNRQIAAQLTLSTETINTHVQNIMRKFEVETKSDFRYILGIANFYD